MDMKSIVKKFKFDVVDGMLKTNVKPSKDEATFIRSNKQEIINFISEEKEVKHQEELRRREVEKELRNKGIVTIYKSNSWGWIIKGYGLSKLRTLALDDIKAKALLNKIDTKYENSDPDLIPEEIAEKLSNGKDEFETTIFEILKVSEIDTKEVEEEIRKEEIKREEKEAFKKEVEKVEILENVAKYEGKEYRIVKVAGFDNSFGEGKISDNWIGSRIELFPKPSMEIEKIIMKAIKK